MEPSDKGLKIVHWQVATEAINNEAFMVNERRLIIRECLYLLCVLSSNIHFQRLNKSIPIPYGT